MTPFEKLTKANGDYHEAVEEIFKDENIDPNTEKRAEKRAEIKAKFGSIANAVFNMMKQAKDAIAPYYEEE